MISRSAVLFKICTKTQAVVYCHLFADPQTAGINASRDTSGINANVPFEPPASLCRQITTHGFSECSPGTTSRPEKCPCVIDSVFAQLYNSSLRTESSIDGFDCID